ncbi:MAG: LysR family transcriptional regulator [Firmicutes bacterium]|nr:LysR family transcriptional regulator [Bacillota bacterium]
MTLQQMIYVLTVAECGSMNKASEKLFVVQPTLTSAIRELEHEMGITIFVRTRKGVTPTAEGAEFLNDLKNFNQHYNTMMLKYQGEGSYKRKFGVSTQHYSFAVKAFVEMAKNYDMNQFEFAIRETRTKQVILDVAALRSEIGVLYVSNQNRKALDRLFTEQELQFHPLVKCRAYVYLWEKHPLAKEPSIGIEQLEPYPCLSFEQDEENPFFSEEILSENAYPKIIRATDRATMLNLMVGLGGYTLCSGIISGDLNGDGFVAVPFREDEENLNSVMEIGYLTKKNSMLSRTARQYIQELKDFLAEAGTADREEIY